MDIPATINKKMTLEGKISYLEKLYNEGTNINALPNGYISADNVIVNNVITNLKSAYQKNKLTVKQITRCESIGIKMNAGKFESARKVDTNAQIEYLKKALSEGINFSDYTYGEKSNFKSSISTYINDIRKKYDNSELTTEQIDTCVNNLKIIIPKSEMNTILNNKIRESALKNIVFGSDISNMF